MSLAAARDAYLSRKDEHAAALIRAVLSNDPDFLEARHLLELLRSADYFEAVEQDRNKLAAFNISLFDTYHSVIGRLGNRPAPDNELMFRLSGMMGEFLFVLMPELRTKLEPFNGQIKRQEIFKRIVETIKPEYIFETGTQFGTTTEYMLRNSRVSVKTTELVHFLYIYATLRFQKIGESEPEILARAGIFNHNSVAFLNQVLGAGIEEPSFFYLDAHGDDMADVALPLDQECRLILQHCRQAVVMIDDILIPDDPGYLGTESESLPVGKLDAVTALFDGAWLPGPSSEETGFRRGCLMLSTEPALSAALDTSPELRRYAGHKLG